MGCTEKYGTVVSLNTGVLATPSAVEQIEAGLIQVYLKVICVCCVSVMSVKILLAFDLWWTFVCTGRW